jgi:rhodanese-related sulfurtransferase
MTPTLSAQDTMGDITTRWPGARRALFARYHIGGCSKCAYQPSETLAEVCARDEDLIVEEVIAHVLSSHENDQKLLMEPLELKAALEAVEPERARVIDIRMREEFEAVAIPGAQLKTPELMAESFATWPKESLIVLADHRGTGAALDAAAYFVGHGFTRARALRGGIDAYAQEAQPGMARYQIEFES